MQVSKEGEKFLIDTKVYLITKGIKEEDVDAFLEDAELHLIEGEKKGKTVSDIFGDSPKAYAEELAKEMEKDKSGIIKSILGMIIGIGGYWLLTNILFNNPNHEFMLTNIQLIGYPIVLMIVGGILFLRGASFQRSMLKKGLLLFGAVILTYLPVLIMFLKDWYSFPSYEVPQLGRYLIGGVMLVITTIVNVRSLGWSGLFVLGIPIFMIVMVEQLVRVFF